MSLESTREFFEIAGRQRMLPLDMLRDLEAEATTRQMEGSSLVLQKGLLTPLDVEIIETLQHPTDSIPGYEIKSVLGRGGMGVVYRARQLALDRVVALKMVLVAQADQPTILARFEQEAQTVARLIHPHIITAFDFGRHAGRLYFAMEYVEGEDAEKYVKRLHPLDERLVWQLIRQSAAGLSHAADEGIVHRDIKPANLLLVSPPKGYPLPPGTPMVKITDFGLAFLSTAVSDRTRLTSELSALGSPHYMAPEQMNAGGVVDLRADLYSLGATAFHLLAGRPPFDGLTLTQIIARKLGDEQPSLHDARPGLTDASVDLVGRLLVRDPQRRIGSYAELLDRIDALPGMNGGVTNATVALTANQTSLTPTIAVAATPATAGHQPWRDLLLTVGTILVLIAGGFTIRHFLVKPTTASSTSASTLKETGWSASLHNGTSLEGWKTDSGSWTTDVDDEGGAVITGTSGEIIRTIAKTIDGRAARVVNYRLTITVRLHAASAIELHFNIAKTGARDVVRLTLDRVSLGHRAGSRAKFEPIDAAQPCEVGVDRLHELRLERDIAVWRVFLDDTEVGVIEASKQAERNEFRLVVEGGPAWFGDVAVEELAPAASGR